MISKPTVFLYKKLELKAAPQKKKRKMGSQSPPKIPVVDFSTEDLKPGSSSWSETCKNVLLALEEFGCFIAVYDKVPSELQSTLFSALEELFDLPKETKMQNVYSNRPYHGYVGQNAFISLHESLGIEQANALEDIQSFSNIMWPNGNDRFWYDSIYFLSVFVSSLDLSIVFSPVKVHTSS